MGKREKLRKDFNVWLGNEFDWQNKESSGQTNRWLLCWDGKEDATGCFDCACCLSDEEHLGCGCICHQRITQIVDFFYDNLNKSGKINKRRKK